MRRSKVTMVALAAALVAAAGCVDGRVRPLTEVEEERPVDPSGSPLIFITFPASGQDFQREQFTNGQGVQVTYAGEFRPRHEVRLLAYLDYPTLASTTPFRVIRYTIEGSPQTAAFVRGPEDQFRDAVGVTILLEMHSPNGFLVSVDSVSVDVR